MNKKYVPINTVRVSCDDLHALGKDTFDCGFAFFFGKGTEPINPINWIGNRLREKLNCHFEHKKKLMRFDRDDQAVMIVIKFDAFSLRLRTSEW